MPRRQLAVDPPVTPGTRFPGRRSTRTDMRCVAGRPERPAASGGPGGGESGATADGARSDDEQPIARVGERQTSRRAGPSHARRPLSRVSEPPALGSRRRRAGAAASDSPPPVRPSTTTTAGQRARHGTGNNQKISFKPQAEIITPPDRARPSAQAPNARPTRHHQACQVAHVFGTLQVGSMDQMPWYGPARLNPLLFRLTAAFHTRTTISLPCPRLIVPYPLRP